MKNEIQSAQIKSLEASDVTKGIDNTLIGKLYIDKEFKLQSVISQAEDKSIHITPNQLTTSCSILRPTNSPKPDLLSSPIESN